MSHLLALQDLLARKGLDHALRLPTRPAHPPLPTGLEALDELLGGGIPRGQITELTGPTSSGRTSLALAIAAGATRRGEAAAYLDAADSLDPLSAEQAGIRLERLLWVRCQGPVATGWQAVNLVADAGGFGLILLDLGSAGKRRLRDWQQRSWVRLQRAIENTPAALVLIAGGHVAASAAALVLELSRERILWSGQPGVSLSLGGIVARTRIAHERRLARWCPERRESRPQGCRLEFML